MRLVARHGINGSKVKTGRDIFHGRKVGLLRQRVSLESEAEEEKRKKNWEVKKSQATRTEAKMFRLATFLASRLVRMEGSIVLTKLASD